MDAGRRTQKGDTKPGSRGFSATDEQLSLHWSPQVPALSATTHGIDPIGLIEFCPSVGQSPVHTITSTAFARLRKPGARAGRRSAAEQVAAWSALWKCAAQIGDGQRCLQHHLAVGREQTNCISRYMRTSPVGIEQCVACTTR